MATRAAKLCMIVLCTLELHSNYQQAGKSISSVAQAFLFHQLKPLTYSHGSQPANASEGPAPQPPGLSQLQRPAGAAKGQQQHLQLGAGPEQLGESAGEPEGCPKECSCNRAAQIVDCSNRNLLKVPQGFPKDTKRIRLERNNISELAAHTFQGLRRLQRIDLSNNMLNRLDPLAFSGGLQSLNSLILYSNKLSQLPPNLFQELSQLQLLLLNANSLQCINKDLFQSLANLNLLSLYDNNIETLEAGTFEGLKNIKTIHLGRNPLACDCNLRWLAEYLESNPIETSEARCESPGRNQAKKLNQLRRDRFKCEGNEHSRTSLIASQCAATSAGSAAAPTATPTTNTNANNNNNNNNNNATDQCPSGCVCTGATAVCSPASQSESRTGTYELPDIPDDVPVYVTRMRINDNRIKRIRQTGLFRRLASAQKLDLGNNKIIDIEDNAINGAANPNAKPERVVFVLLENEHCDAASAAKSQSSRPDDSDPCSTAPRVNGPQFDSPCYNGGSCLAGSAGSMSPAALASGYSGNYSCACPPGFAGRLCEVNVDDCADHQCQNGAACVDGVNSYRCVCRDPTTAGEYCEQLNSGPASSSAGGPVALPMIAAAAASAATAAAATTNYQASPPMPGPEPGQQRQQASMQILARSADFYRAASSGETSSAAGSGSCKRVTQRKFYDDGNGCQSVRMLKLSDCLGSCSAAAAGSPSSPPAGAPSAAGCCGPARVKRRRIRMQCTDGASYVKTIDLVKKCACAPDCAHLPQQTLAANYNATQEDQVLQITRLDAVD